MSRTAHTSQPSHPRGPLRVRMVTGVAAAIAAAALLVACSSSEPPADPQVRTLKLPTDQPPLPEGPGRDAFYASCLNCHSTRYVGDQPRFPRKTWIAEVDKMMKTYGAPVPPDQVPAIVDYLVAVRGTED